MKKISKYIAILSVVFLSLDVKAEGRAAMADLMRSNGKIYVVVAVLVIIFTMLLIYLISLDKKIRKLEKTSKEQES